MATYTRRTYGFGRAGEATHPDSVRAASAEFLSTFVFVFAGEGSLLALDKLYWDTAAHTGTNMPGGLILVAFAHALALFASVSGAINLLGAIVACLLLRLATDGLRPIGFHVTTGVSELHGLVMEIVLTFALVYVVYSTAIDPKRRSIGIIAPLAIGLIVGANILVGGSFDGASMNPTRAFGPALVGWRWHNHWIYWVGPFIGGALAALIYEYMVIPNVKEPPHHSTHQPLVPEDY
ncbi:hypothetical protein AALP_AA2G239800 [Arabis alpina]|uniref:Tonoplast intrinsic protein n=1 Tax=Arabis alpina TaxID=50452 RepID=A0A087HJL2_ARAAL|nr:hypothetical protein AALP_AA2G239800 [Arabis alpina]